MAITAITQPTLNDPHLVMGKDKIILKLSSDSADIISCIVEVIVLTSSDNERVSAFNVQPDIGTTDEFTIVLNDVLMNHLDFGLNSTDLSSVNVDELGAKRFNVKVYEVTEDPSTKQLTTAYDPDLYPNPSADYILPQDRVFVNLSIDTLGKAFFNVDDYKLDGNTKKFLTDTPSAKSIELGQSEYLGLLYCEATPSLNYKAEYLTYDASGSLLNTDYLNITEWDSPFAGYIVNPYLDIPVGTSNLISMGISLTNVAYYTVRIVNDNGDVSELKRFNIVDDTSKDTRIHWQNKYGKRESYTFKGNIKEVLKTSKGTFMTPSSLTYSSEERGLNTLQNTLNNEFTAYTRSIGRETYEWLTSILFNNRAWVEINGEYLPIIIEDGRTVKSDEEQNPYQFILSYKLANPSKGLKA